MYVKKVQKGVDKADESENTKEQVIDRESNQKESHPESIEDETVEKVRLISTPKCSKIFLCFFSLLLKY